MKKPTFRVGDLACDILVSCPNSYHGWSVLSSPDANGSPWSAKWNSLLWDAQKTVRPSWRTSAPAARPWRRGSFRAIAAGSAAADGEGEGDHDAIRRPDHRNGQLHRIEPEIREDCVDALAPNSSTIASHTLINLAVSAERSVMNYPLGCAETILPPVPECSERSALTNVSAATDICGHACQHDRAPRHDHRNTVPAARRRTQSPGQRAWHFGEAGRASVEHLEKLQGIGAPTRHARRGQPR